MVKYSVEKEYQGMLDAYERAGGDVTALRTKNVAKLVVHENKVLSANEVDGVRLSYEPRENGISAELLVEDGIKDSSLFRHPAQGGPSGHFTPGKCWQGC